ncbi:MAG TPA: hypothetical protein VNP72_10685 [Longimicrobium sp.]|nr:hypothetical protein [Longimicrobium sp.]
MRTLIRTAAVAAALLALPPVLAAQAGTPLQAAERYFGHLRAANIEGLSEMTHPAALQSLKDSLFTFIPADELPAEGDAATMRQLPAAALYQFILAALHGEMKVGDVAAGMELRTLGVVAAGADRAHVVYSATFPIVGHPVQMTQVLTLRLHEGAWKVDAGPGLSTLLGGGMLPLFLAGAVEEGLEGRLEGDDDGGR